MLSWIKVRPEIELYTVASVIPGAPFRVRVVLRCAAAVAINGVDLELRGELVSIGESHVVHRFLRQRAHLHDGGELDHGEHSFVTELLVPATAPVSYIGERLRVEYTLRAEVDIPWWPDARAAYRIYVRRPGEDRPAIARVYATLIAEPPGSAPHLEVSLQSDAILLGGALEGAAAIVHAQGRQIQALSADLVAIERSPSFGVHRARKCEWPLSGAFVADDAAPLRFRLRLPGDLVPGFEFGEYGLHWALVVKADLARGRDLELMIPLKVARGGDEVDAGGERRAALAVGSERQALLWREVARVTGLDDVGGALVGKVGEVSLEIARERRPGVGEVVVAAIDARGLAIGLSLASARGGAAPSLRSRDMSQATWLEGQLADARGELHWAAADDEELRLEIRDAGRDARGLVAFVGAVQSIARRVDEIRDQVPPPRVLADRRPRWVEAGRRLGARLRPGDLALFGRGDGHTFSLVHEWDHRGEVLRTRLEVRPEVAIDERHHLRWRSLDGAPPISELPIAALCDGAWQVEIDRDALRVVIAGDVDPVAEVTRIQALQALADRLSGRLGLYR